MGQSNNLYTMQYLCFERINITFIMQQVNCYWQMIYLLYGRVFNV